MAVSILTASSMIKEHNLSVLFTLNLSPCCSITRILQLWIYVYDLSISLVPELEAFLGIGIYSEIW